MFSKKIATFLLFLVLNAYTQINPTDSTVPILSYWKKGDIKQYTIKKESSKTVNNILSKDVTQFDVKIKILKESQNSYQIEWTYRNAKSNSKIPIINKILNLMDNIKIIYNTDNTGTFAGIVNWIDLKSKIKDKIKKIRQDDLFYADADPKLILMEQVLDSKTSIENYLIKEIQQFHTFHGFEYKIGAPIEADSEIPNAFGKEPLAVKTKTKVANIDSITGNITLESTQSVNSKQLANTTQNFTNSIAKNHLGSNDTLELKSAVNETTIKSTIDQEGWIVLSERVLNLEIMDTKITESFIIKPKQ